MFYVVRIGMRSALLAVKGVAISSSHARNCVIRPSKVSVGMLQTQISGLCTLVTKTDLLFGSGVLYRGG